MKKMTTLFVVTYTEQGQKGIISPEVRPENAWVLAGEGIATIKMDGTAACVKIIDGAPKLFLRYDAKILHKFKKHLGTDQLTTAMFKQPPAGAIPCMEKPDAKTGHYPFWIPMDPANPQHKWALEAWLSVGECLSEGTYELIGPEIQANRYGLTEHQLYKHGQDVLPIEDFSFDSLKKVVTELHAEGIVFHHKSGDGRMCKLRRGDFGLDWPLVT